MKKVLMAAAKVTIMTPIDEAEHSMAERSAAAHPSSPPVPDRAHANPTATALAQSWLQSSDDVADAQAFQSLSEQPQRLVTSPTPHVEELESQTQLSIPAAMARTQKRASVRSMILSMFPM